MQRCLPASQRFTSQLAALRISQQLQPSVHQLHTRQQGKSCRSVPACFRQRSTAAPLSTGASEPDPTTTAALFPTHPALLRPVTVIDPPVTVLLIGWLGCSERNLAKFAALHKSIGTTSVVSYRPSALAPFVPSLSYAPSVDLLLQVRAELQQDPSRRLALHLMSNNGAFHCAYLLHLLHTEPSLASTKEDLLARLDAVIFDSAPCDLETDILARGYLGFVSGMLWHRPRYEHPLFTPLARAVFAALLQLPFLGSKQMLLHRALHRFLPTSAHLLFLYSTADQLIPAVRIQAYAKEQTDAGKGNVQVIRLSADAVTEDAKITARFHLSSASRARVVAHCDFGVSAHVQHLRYFPDLYRNLTRAFLQHAVQSPCHGRI